MADLYVSDSTYAKYVAEYGAEEAKAEIRSVVKANAPEVGDE
jgi:hypothetical protein